MTSSKKVSLSEVNQSIDTPNNNRFWQNLKAFLRSEERRVGRV